MSKSLGNSEDAADAVNRIGADVHPPRVCLARLHHRHRVSARRSTTAVAESYRKIRNTCRFMLGNLADFDPARDAVPHAADARVRSLTCWRAPRTLKADVRRAYEAFDFQAAYHAMLNFVGRRSEFALSSTWRAIGCIAAAANSRERRSAQTALYHVLDALVRMLAALIPFTADEIYSHMPGEKRRRACIC